MSSSFIFSTAYFPPLSYFSSLLKAKEVLIEHHEHYFKQTYRNRAEIYGANEMLLLAIPVDHQNLFSIPIKEVRISYRERWQKIHWRSIESAYRNSPYFEYYEDELSVFYEKEYEFLCDWNHDLLMHVLKILGMDKKISFTESYQEQHEDVSDLRNEFIPGKKLTTAKFSEVQYKQVFSDRHGFIPDLSILDLIFNEGHKALDWLEKMSV